MSTRIALDSSTVAALFFKDPMSERVEQAITNYDQLHTLDLAYAEVGNVAWKRVHLFKEDTIHVSKSLDMALQFIQDNCDVSPCSNYLKEALTIAIDNGITIYDSLFLTLARHFKTRLLTVDEKLHDKISESKKMADLIALPQTRS